MRHDIRVTSRSASPITARFTLGFYCVGLRNHTYIRPYLVACVYFIRSTKLGLDPIKDL